MAVKTVKPKSGKKEVFGAIIDERFYQDQKHGYGGHELATWLLLMESELEEAKRAVVKGGSGRDSALSEITQVAALCVAALEQFGLQAETSGRMI